MARSHSKKKTRLKNHKIFISRESSLRTNLNGAQNVTKNLEGKKLFDSEILDIYGLVNYS